MARIAYLAIAFSVFAVAAPAQEPSAKRGRDIYMKTGCYTCHGTVGQGTNVGLKLAPDPLPAEAIANFIRNTDTTAPSYAAMPTYSADVLSDAEVADIAAYLSTVPPSKDPDTIPALKGLTATR